MEIEFRYKAQPTPEDQERIVHALCLLLSIAADEDSECLRCEQEERAREYTQSEPRPE